MSQALVYNGVPVRTGADMLLIIERLEQQIEQLTEERDEERHQRQIFERQLILEKRRSRHLHDNAQRLTRKFIADLERDLKLTEKPVGGYS